MLGRVSRLSSRYAATKLPDLVDIVDTIGLLLVKILIEMATQRRRGEGLVAVWTLLVLDGSRFGASGVVRILRGRVRGGSIIHRVLEANAEVSRSARNSGLLVEGRHSIPYQQRQQSET